jgi:MGT family glycosyltransferase
VTAGPKVAFFNLPAAGHVNPTLPLIAELARRGVHVLYYAGDESRAQVIRQGAEFRSYGAHLTYDHSQLPSNLLGVAAVIALATEQLLPVALGETRRERPDAVISDSMCPWGRLAAQACGVPGIASLSTFAFDPAILREGASPSQFARTIAAGAGHFVRFRRAGKRIRRKHGLHLGSLFDLFVFRDRMTIVYTSRAFQPHQDRFDDSVRFVGPLLRETEDLDEHLARQLGDDPLVYVSLGTVANDRLGFYRACLDAFADGDHKVLLSVGTKVDPVALGPIPPNCVVRPFVPQLAVLQRARLFVTHGGMNSVSEGLAHGVPLVVYPQSVEERTIGWRVQELGAGLLIGDRDADPAGIRGAASAALAGGCANAARAIARSFEDAGGAPAAADAVTEVIASGSAAVPRLDVEAAR